MISRAQKVLRQSWNELERAKGQTHRQTELGIERFCTGCNEWWPEDSEFFYYVSTRQAFGSRCKACHASSMSASSRKRLIKSGEDHTIAVA